MTSTNLNMSSDAVYISGNTSLTINKITRGRPSATWSSQPGRTYSITHNQGAGCTIIATAEHSLNDLVCTVRNKTATTADIDVYHRAGANVTGTVWVNWVAIATTN